MTQNTLRILLAEDDKDDRFFFQKAINELSSPIQLTMVEDGEKLMELLQENSKPLPDVLFLDINMPKKRGDQCLKEIKSNDKLKAIPVVIYSTALYDEIADILYKGGAHYYLQKCNFTELPGAIQNALTLLKKDPERASRDKFILKQLVTK